MGTTLVQRLLCSSGDCLIFGDAIGHDAAFFASYLTSKQIGVRSQAPRTDPLLESVLGGNTADFMADLAPQSEAYLDALASMAAGPLILCRETARSHGRPLWGWKQAGVQAWFIRLLPSVFPKARIIHVERDLASTVRSAKAAAMIGEGADFSRFVQETQLSRQALSELSGKLPVFSLTLATLLDEPEVTLSSLEEFTGCALIDRGVLSVKLNHPHTDWLPPAELSEEEAALIETIEPSTSHAFVA